MHSTCSTSLPRAPHSPSNNTPLKPVSSTSLLILDLAGTFVFALEAATTAVQHELDLLGIMVLAFVTALGGGILPDIFLAQAPAVLRTDIYAAAALFGAAVLVLVRKLKLQPALASMLAIIACFALRMAAVQPHWNLP